MKRKLALFLALVMIFTSTSSMTLSVRAADALETITSEGESLTNTTEEVVFETVEETVDASEEIPKTETLETIETREMTETLVYAETEDAEESETLESETVKESETQVATEEAVVEETVAEEETQESAEVLSGGADFASAEELSVGVDATASIQTAGQMAYFKYTVPAGEGGTYYFYSISGSDTYGYMYNDLGEQIASDDDSGDGYDFQISYRLQDGDTYYYGVQYLDGQITGEIPVMLEKAPEVTSFSVTPPSSTTFYEGVDYFVGETANVYIEYSNGTVKEGMYGDVNRVSFADVFYHVRSKEDSTVEYSRGDYIPKGSYEVIFECGEFTAAYDVQVEDIRNASLPVWSVGTEMTLTFPKDAHGYYTFTPGSTAKYRLTGGSECWDHGHSYEIYTYSEEYGMGSIGGISIGGSWNVTAGQTYYIREECQYRETETYTLTLEPSYAVTEIKVVEAASECIANIDSYIGNGARIEVTYSNGETAELLFENDNASIQDNYGNWFQYCITQGSGEEAQRFEAWETLNAGEYNLVFEYDESGERFYTSIPIRVKDFSEISFTELSENSEANLTLGGKQSMMYRFVPEQDGTYRIQWNEINDVMDIHTEFYRRTETGWEKTETWGGSVTAENLVKGETYYVRITNQTGDSADLVLKAVYCPVVTKVELIQQPKKNSFAEGIEQIVWYDSDIRIKITYSNGETAESGIYETDVYDNYVGIDTYLIEDENETYISDAWNLPVGSYVRRITCGNLSVDFPFNIIPLEEAADGELKENSEMNLILDANESKLYRFVPEQDGDYEVSFYTEDPEGNGYVNIYEKTETGWENTGIENLVKGKAYYVRVISRMETSADWVLKVVYQPDVTDIELIRQPKKNVFVKALENVQWEDSDFRVKIIYSNGETAEKGMYEQDAYNNYVDDDIYLIEDGNETYLGDIWGITVWSVGSYVRRISVGNQNVDFPFSVIPADEAADGEIVPGQGETVIEDNTEDKIYKVVITEAGTYKYQSNVPVELTVVDENGVEVSQRYVSNYVKHIKLAAGTYYFHIEANTNYYPSFKFNLEKITGIESVDISLSNTEYMVLDKLNMSGVEVVINYADGTKYTTHLKESVITVRDGSSVQFYIESDTEKDLLNSKQFMQPGNYRITAQLWGEDTVVLGESGEIHVLELDMSEFRRIQADELVVPETGEKDFLFVPAEDSAYQLKDESGNLLGDSVREIQGYVYSDESLGFIRADLGTAFEAGKTYLIRVDGLNEMKFKIEKYTSDSSENPGTPEVPEGANSGKLEIDKEELVHLNGEIGYVDYTFTPLESGMYTLESIGEWDTYVSLYRGEDESQIASDDDGSDNGNNFKLSYYMNAGETYRYRVKMYSAMVDVREFNILLTHPEYKAITSAEVVKTQEEFKPGDTLNSNIWKSMQWKLTYEDGTTTEFMPDGNWEQKDEYGNRVFMERYDRVEGTDILSAYFYYENVLEETPHLVAEFEFKVLSLESLSKPYVLGRKVEVASDTEAYYQFKTERSGVYQIDLQYEGGHEYNVEVLDENANTVWRDYDYGYASNYYVLEGGKTYYFKISCGSDTKASVVLQRTNRVKSIQVTASEESLVMYKNIGSQPDCSDWEITVQYEDGTNETMDCKNSMVDISGEYLNDTRYRCYVAYRKCRTFIDVEVRDPSALEGLQEGVLKNIDVNGQAYYRFTPVESGYYYISHSNLSGGSYGMSIVDENGDSVGNQNCMHLFKDRNYYIIISVYSGHAEVEVMVKNVAEKRDVQLYADYPVRIPVIDRYGLSGSSFGRLEARIKDGTICTAEVLQQDNQDVMVELTGKGGGSTQVDVVDTEYDIVVAVYNIQVSDLPEDAVMIKDIGLSSYLLNIVFENWNSGYISKDMMESLTYLDLGAWTGSYKIYDLSGLEYAKNLRTLSLGNQTGVTDVSVAKQLPSLNTLDLRGTEVSSAERWTLADFGSVAIHAGDRIILPSLRYLFEEGFEVRVVSGNDNVILDSMGGYYSLTGLQEGTVKLEITYETYKKEIEVQISGLGTIEAPGKPFDGTAEIGGIIDLIGRTDSDMKILDSNGNLWATYPEAKKESENVKQYVADVVYQLGDNGIQHNEVELILDNNGVLFKNGTKITENVVEFDANYALTANGNLIDLVYGDIEPMKNVVSWECDRIGNGDILLSDGTLIRRSIRVEDGKTKVTDTVYAENIKMLQGVGYIDSDNNLRYGYMPDEIVATGVESFTKDGNMSSYYGTDGNLYLRMENETYVNVGEYKLKKSLWVYEKGCMEVLMENGELYAFDRQTGEMTLFDTEVAEIVSSSYTKMDGTHWTYDKEQIGTSIDNPLVVKYAFSPKNQYTLLKTSSDKDCIVTKNGAVIVMDSVTNIWDDHGMVYALRTDGTVWNLENGKPEKVLTLESELILPEVTNLKAEALNVTQVKLTWSSVDKAEGYLVYRKVQGENEFKLIKTLEETSYTDMKAVTGETNFYRVCPYYTNSSGEQVTGAVGKDVSARPMIGAVQNLKAVSAGKNRVKLTWSSVDKAEGYLVYAQKDGKYSYVGMTTRGTTFTDTKALDNDYNFYWVFAYVKDANGKMHPGGCEKYTFAKGICTAVTNLRASSVTGGVKLTWTVSAGAEGYLIYGMNGANSNYHYIGMTTRGTTFTDRRASKTDWNFYWVFPYHKNAEGKMMIGGTAKYVFGKAK